MIYSSLSALLASLKRARTGLTFADDSLSNRECAATDRPDGGSHHRCRIRLRVTS